MLGCAVMEWFVKTEAGRDVGPMTETELRRMVSDGQVRLVRRASSQVWVDVQETPFVRPPSTKASEKRLADLTRREAHALIRGAVAWGVFAGILLLALVGALFATLQWVLTMK